MKKVISILVICSLIAFASLAFSTTAFAKEGPKTGEIWICPSVSTNNQNGMWVVGHHGAYYIITPGTSSPNWPMILNPTENLDIHAGHVEHIAQTAAGSSLYKDYPTYPYFEGMAMVLQDGADAFGLAPGPQFISAGQLIPIASAVFW